MKSIKTFDFSTTDTTKPHDKLKSWLKSFVFKIGKKDVKRILYKVN